MTLSQRKRDKINRLFWSGSGSPVLDALTAGLVWTNENSITGDPVTAINNLADGGPDYSYTVVGGTAAALTTTTINGLSSVQGDGTVWIESAAGKTISGPNTQYVVVKSADLTLTHHITDARSDAAARQVFYTANSVWRAFQQAIISVVGALDTNVHILTAHFNGDETSSLKVSGVGTIVGNMGVWDYDHGTLFGAYNGVSNFVGAIPERIILPYKTTSEFDTSVENYLGRWIT